MSDAQSRSSLKRRVLFWKNRIFAQVQIRQYGKLFRFVIPDRFRLYIKYLKYFTAVVGLLSAFFTFDSVWIAFGFGCLVLYVSWILEMTAFSHSYLFVHPLPKFELDPEKWLGMGLGFFEKRENPIQIPLVSMMVKDLEYAKHLHDLFLSWTGGKYKDDDKSIQAIIVVLSPKEYIFFCYPNMKRPIAATFFGAVKEDLRKTSLDDEVSEHQVFLILGKRCHIGPGSYFPEFRKKYRVGSPVMFEFLKPPFDSPRSFDEIQHPFTLFDFSIKDKSELTRKDVVYDLVEGFSEGGKWLGPEHLNPGKRSS